MLGLTEIVKTVGLADANGLQFLTGREHFDVYYYEPTKKSYFVFDNKANADCMVVLSDISEVDIAKLIRRALTNGLVDVQKVFKKDYIDEIEENYLSIEDFLDNDELVIPASKINREYLLQDSNLCCTFNNGIEVENGYIVEI